MSKSKTHKRQKHQPRARNQQSATQKETHNHAHRERGWLLTLAIVLVILNNVVTTVFAYYDLTINAIEVKSLYLPVLFITSIAGVIGGIGMWLWKRWGFYLYIAAALVSATAALMNTGYLMVLFAAILPPIIVAYIYLPKQKFFD